MFIMKKFLFYTILLAFVMVSAAFINKLPKVKKLDLAKTYDNSSNTKILIKENEESVVSAVEKALPSVVTVSINTTVSTPGTFEINPFDFFEVPRYLPETTKKIEKNIGSGFIVSKDGLIITNRHVVSDTNSQYKVMTNDKKIYNVEKIYRDPLNDLAILKINETSLMPLSMGDSSSVKLGQTAIAIGTPLGEFTNTVTKGIVSGLGRGITAGSPYEGYVEKLDNVIQTDAPINPGNSGGPLLDISGKAIGVNAAIAESGQSIGFAIPINVVKDLVEKFNKNGGSFERPYIGVRYKMVDKETAILNSVAEGAYIIEVIKNSPAAKAGIQEEDIIVEFDDKKVLGENDQELAKLILNKKIGDQVEIRIWRNGQTQTLSLTVASSP